MHAAANNTDAAAALAKHAIRAHGMRVEQIAAAGSRGPVPGGHILNSQPGTPLAAARVRPASYCPDDPCVELVPLGGCGCARGRCPACHREHQMEPREVTA
jgi:hypothetical protein